MPLLTRFLLLGLCLIGAGATLRGQSSWSGVPSGTPHSLWGICYGAGQFVAVGEHGTILTSDVGTKWTMRTTGVDVLLTAVTYALEHYVAVGNHGTVLVSRDGIVWRNLSDIRAGVPDVRLNVVASVGNRILIYGENSQVMTLYLPAQLGWYDAPPLSALSWRAFAAGLDRYIIGGEAGILVETEGNELLGIAESTYTDVRNVTGIVFDGEAFAAVGKRGEIITSTDARSWARVPSPVTADFQAIGTFNHTLVAVGEGGKIVTRDTHGAWIQRTSPTLAVLTGIAASDSLAVIVGHAGTILCAEPDTSGTSTRQISRR